MDRNKKKEKAAKETDKNYQYYGPHQKQQQLTVGYLLIQVQQFLDPRYSDNYTQQYLPVPSIKIKI